MKKLLFCMLTMASIVSQAQKVWDYDDFTVTKVSNPDHGEREVDGLIPGGDRQNSYTWRLAGRGDEIYIATARNIASALVNIYGTAIAGENMSMDTFWAMINLVTNGDIMRNDVNEGANIIAYNRKTGEFRVAYTADEAEYQRMALTYGDNVFFGSYSANPAVVQYILKLDPDGNFTKVFETPGTTAMRANCVYDNHLFFASVDARTTVEEGNKQPIVKMAVLRMDNDDNTVWDCVADYKDFGNIPYDPIQTSWAGAPFWELASHAGYIYATAPSMAGFVIFRGRPAQQGETANKYGWHWEEVAGPNNGINNPGLSDVEGGEPGTMRSLIGSVYEFEGELYAYNFDHAFGGEAQAFVGMLQQLTGADVKASDYLSYMYNSLHNPQKVWKLNDDTGKFEELTAFTQLMEGTTNEYIWRMGDHNGKLYVATMDAGIFYNYLTQLTNSSFFRMTRAERLSKIAYLNTVIQLLAQAQGNEKADELRSLLEELRQLLSEYSEAEVIDEDNMEIITGIQQITEEIGQFLAEAAEEGVAAQMAAISAAIAQAAENAKDNNVELFQAFKELIVQLASTEVRDQWRQKWEEISAASPEEMREKIHQLVQDAFGQMLIGLKNTSHDIYTRIDGKGIEMYSYINNAVRTNEWGFDLFRTADGGQTFEVITRTGFDDKYNYGCPSFLSTEEGLYFGTCNPFYGGQLFLLSEKDKTPTAINQVNAKKTQANSNTYYTLSGVAIKGTPSQKGLYIKDGKKVAKGF